MARRASLTEGSARAVKSYKAKVASLTYEKADFRAQIKNLIEELVKHKSNLKHTSKARTWAEDKEKKARKDLRVAEDELRLAREELQAVKGDLRVKVTTLDRVRQKAFEAGSSLERLTEELDKLQGDFERQEALVSQRDGVIAKLRDEVSTEWASGWLAFQHRASRAFPDLEFNFQLSDKEAEESVFKADANAEVLFGGL